MENAETNADGGGNAKCAAELAGEEAAISDDTAKVSGRELDLDWMLRRGKGVLWCGKGVIALDWESVS